MRRFGDAGRTKIATLKGRVLLGWLSRDAAIQFLLKECVFDPPIDAAAAESIWQDYRTRVDALPVRAQSVPPNLGLTVPKVAHSIKFKNFLASVGPHNVIDVEKLDLSALTVS